ncbi:MAG: M23 family metallopeptidase [Bacteroidetes bacterium]|nr:M23 family metallopeptidase [Bacteroidota bacterium]
MKIRNNNLHIEQQIKINKKIFNSLRITLLWLAIIAIIHFIFVYKTYTPKTFHLKQQSEELQQKYLSLQNEIRENESKIDILKDRNNNIYRAVYGLDPIEELQTNIKQPAEMYAHLKTDRFKNMIMSTWQEIDNVSTELVTASISLDDINILAKEQFNRLNYIPSIWPINMNALRGNIGSFGSRIHPIFKTRIFHKGIDLSCKRGTNIYATADGRVVLAKKGWNGGYGSNLKIDHGYGYMTRYAHLGSLKVKVGQKVKRGEVIALSGNSGRSTGPHLHYEVIYRKRHVNPINYFRRTMSEEEFMKIVERVKDTSYEEQ